MCNFQFGFLLLKLNKTRAINLLHIVHINLQQQIVVYSKIAINLTCKKENKTALQFQHFGAVICPVLRTRDALQRHCNLKTHRKIGSSRQIVHFTVFALDFDR